MHPQKTRYRVIYSSPMNKRINDIRRCILALCFFGLVLSLIGRELPWCKITQSTPQNPIYILDEPTCNATANNGTLPSVNELTFTLDVYMTLTASQICQTFVKGVLPSYIGGAILHDIRMCTHLKFDQVSNFMQDVSQWDSYSSQCGSAGGGTFFFVISALVITAVTMIINTFPKVVDKCCQDQNSFKNKFIRSLVAFFAPAFVTFGLIVYSVQCVNGDIGSVLTKRKMDRTGAGGYYVCCVSCAMLWIYWGLFLFRMCDNEVQIDFKKAGDIRTKFLSRNKKESDDVDAGMIDESQEQRETVQGIVDSGAYDESYAKVSDDNAGDQTRKITAYDDDDDGAREHNPSAGSWQDVEED